MGLIYKITNNKNNKIYVGQTSTSLDNRWKRHLKIALDINNKIYSDDGMIIYRAMRKYGVENFSISVIEDDIKTKKELNERESYWIDKYNCIRPNGYNIRKGGDDCGSKSVYKIDAKTNQIIEQYISASEAAEKNNIDLSGLTKACRGETSGAGLFKWCYVENYNKEKINNVKFIKRKAPVYQLEFGTKNILKEYDSISAAAKEIGIDPSSINRVVNNLRKNCISAGGFGWCFIEDFEKYEIPKITRGNRIYQLDKDTLEILNEYENANKASQAIKGNNSGASLIRKASKDITKTAYGYKWRLENVK